MRNPEKTFNWLVDLLQRHDVPFVIGGGLAAKSYGSPRPLNDIDIDIPTEDFGKILPDITPYIIFGPARYQDARWDLSLITLNHEGQEVDIGGAGDTKIYNSGNGQWEKLPPAFDHSEQREIFGRMVPVMARVPLAAYKALLDGDHQKIDIDAILAHGSPA